MKWKSEFERLGLSNETISQGLKNKIKDYNEVVETINEAKEKIANPSLNDDVDDLNENLQDLESVLEDLDNKLVRAIQIFHKNKDKYAELGNKMKEGREKKKLSKNQPAPTPNPTPNPAPAPNPTPNPTPNADDNKDGEKKKGNWGLFFGALALGIITFGIYKSRD
jgi:septum formation inhibitor MinC